MSGLKITIDSQSIECTKGQSILEAADGAGIYIPRLCYHPDLPAAGEISLSKKVYQHEMEFSGGNSDTKAGEYAHCNLCYVKIEGQSEPVRSCETIITNNLIVKTQSENITKQRQKALSTILSHHPHACLTCAQKEGCSRTDCSSNVPVEERCCVLLGNCELEKVSDYIGIPGYTPRYIPKTNLVPKDEPLFIRDYNLCIGCSRCVRICQKVQGPDILGAVVQNNKLSVGTINGPKLIEAECRFCTACVEVCPTGTLLDKENLPKIKSDTPLPCVSCCPAGIDIPNYLQAIAAGNHKKVLNIIRDSVPFPEILGYVCFHPCEENCRRGEIDSPVSICALKRFAADANMDPNEFWPEKRPDTNKNIAVIGSGPAGLSAAYYLASFGHQVDIYEQAEKPGGMLRYGIPDYRLPSDVLERDIAILEKLGVKFILNHKFNDPNYIDKLKSQPYDSILIATGASMSRNLKLENSDIEGIIPGLEFLKQAKGEEKLTLSGKAVIIGGGNVAIDAAMTAIRLGAEMVELYCLESRTEMPALDWEITQAEDEGVIINNSWGPKKFLSDNSLLSGIEFKKCTQVFDETGAFAPQFDEEITRQISAKTAIITIGQQISPELFEQNENLSKSDSGWLKTDENYSVGHNGVFAVGDVVRGPSSVIDAIADGRQVAEEINKSLGGQGNSEFQPEKTVFDGSTNKIDQNSFMRPRFSEALVEPKTRKTGFGLIERTFSEKEAIAEASRCLMCHIRKSLSPVTFPPERIQPFDEKSIATVPDTDGVCQLLNDDKKVIQITGVANMQKMLTECLENPGEAKWFICEEDPMYSKRETELIQQYLQKYGEMPGGRGGDDGGDSGDDLDDLF